MLIVKNSILPPKGYYAITILNMILVRRGTHLSATDINHERIHYEQEKELLFVGFYLLYLVFFLIGIIRYRHWDTAYRRISFEREAYKHQGNLHYIRSRRHYAWARKRR